jgi:hypothetical protein
MNHREEEASSMTGAVLTKDHGVDPATQFLRGAAGHQMASAPAVGHARGIRRPGYATHGDPRPEPTR